MTTTLSDFSVGGAPPPTEGGGGLIKQPAHWPRYAPRQSGRLPPPPRPPPRLVLPHHPPDRMAPFPLCYLWPHLLFRFVFPSFSPHNGFPSIF